MDIWDREKDALTKRASIDKPISFIKIDNKCTYLIKCSFNTNVFYRVQSQVKKKRKRNPYRSKDCNPQVKIKKNTLKGVEKNVESRKRSKKHKHKR